MKNSDKFIEAMSGIDDNLLTAHIHKKNPTKAQKILRYTYIAAAYAAACLVLALVIPMFIGNDTAPTPVIPGEEPIASDTVESTTETDVNPPEPDEPSENTVIFNGCEFSITLDKNSYTLNDTVSATVTLVNKGEKAVGLWQGYLGDFLDEVVFSENGEARRSYSSDWGKGYAEACQWGPFEPGGSITHTVEFTPGAPKDSSDPIAEEDSLWEITAYVAYYADAESEDPYDSIQTATVTIEVPHKGNEGVSDPEESEPEEDDPKETVHQKVDVDVVTTIQTVTESGDSQPQPVPKKYYSIYDAKRLTTKNSGVHDVVGFTYREYLDGKTPMYGITFWEFRLTADNKVYSIRYDYTFDAYYGKIVGKKIIEDDNTYKHDVYEVYKSQNSIPYGISSFYGYEMVEVCETIDETLTKIGSRADLQKFINNIKQNTSYNAGNHDDIYKLVDCLSKYDDAFFAENVMYVHAKTQSSCDLSPDVVKVAIDGSTLSIGLQEYRPTPATDGVKGNVFVLTFSRDDLKGVKSVKATSTILNLDDPEDITPQMSKVYPKPADSVKIRFFKDKKLTDEYKSASAIPYGATVYYKIECDEGYICTNVKFNVYTVSSTKEYTSAGWKYYDYFVNEYVGDSLEYSCSAVLAGDSDGNWYYDMNDVETIRKYLEGDTPTIWEYGIDGYSAKLDYDCNGVVDNADCSGMLDEISGKTVKRNVMSTQKYTREVGTKKYLLQTDDAVVFSTADTGVTYIDYDYYVYDNAHLLYLMSEEIQNKYNEKFFENYNLVAGWCYTPDASEVSTIWYTGNDSQGYLRVTYDDAKKAGHRFGDFVMFIALPKNIAISDTAPV